jgi:type I site-specific restriction endonuclease
VTTTFWPHKVIRVDLDKDAFGWRYRGHDRQGDLIEDRIYTGADMNSKVVLENPTPPWPPSPLLGH